MFGSAVFGFENERFYGDFIRILDDGFYLFSGTAGF